MQPYAHALHVSTWPAYESHNTNTHTSVWSSRFTFSWIKHWTTSVCPWAEAW